MRSFSHLKNIYSLLSICPYGFYKKHINIESVFKCSECFALRRIDDYEINVFRDDGKVRADFIEVKEIPSLSLNILGGKFNLKHSRYRIINRGSHVWNGVWLPNLIALSRSYEVKAEYCNVYFNCNKIHGTEFPNMRNFTDKSFRHRVEKFKKNVEKHMIESAEEFKLKGYINIEHKPTMFNYWHVQLALFEFDGNAIKYGGQAFVKDICKHILEDVLSVHSSKYVENIGRIPNKEFIVLL